MSTQIYVFADWHEPNEFTLDEPILVGTLRSSSVKNKEHFSFTYDDNWLRSSAAQKIDPNLEFYAGEQHGSGEQNFGAFLDSCPDRWGRLLMKRREAAIARQVEDDKTAPTQWLMMLIAPGSSLGGARPKSCVVDEKTVCGSRNSPVVTMTMMSPRGSM